MRCQVVRKRGREKAIKKREMGGVRNAYVWGNRGKRDHDKSLEGWGWQKKAEGRGFLTQCDIGKNDQDGGKKALKEEKLFQSTGQGDIFPSSAKKREPGGKDEGDQGDGGETIKCCVIQKGDGGGSRWRDDPEKGRNLSCGESPDPCRHSKVIVLHETSTRGGDKKGYHRRIDGRRKWEKG